MKRSLTILLVLCITAFLPAQQFRAVDTVIENSIRNHIFPGAGIIVGTPSKILYQKSYGHFTYDPDSKLVNDESLFDLASCTKVFATTSCIMKLTDEGKVNLDAPVARYLPEFAQNGKQKVKLRNLLLHNSGLQSYYSPKPDESPEDIWKAISALPLEYKTGKAMVYSCLNFITTMKVIEAVTKMPMYKYYADNFTIPLKMTHTMFTPPLAYMNECLPTTPALQGSVHDPLAAGLKGLSGNAGLFSTTGDLSKICQILLDNGKYEGHRIFSPKIVKTFTTRYSKESSRALGWDTKSDSGFSSAGKLFSANSFGHTGYTGTCAWMDPVRKIFVIFLTNRVYPDDKANVGHVRAAVNDAVISTIQPN